MFPPHIHEMFEHTWVNETVVITYETVMVGYQDGIVYLGIYPDVYAKGTNKPARVRVRLAEYALEQAVSDSELTQLLKKPDGVVRPLLGSDMPITVDGSPATSLIGPTIRNHIAYLPLSSLAAMIGATATWNPAAATGTLMKGERVKTFRVERQEGFPALGTLFVPAREAVESMGGSVRLAANTLAINTASAAK